MTHDFQTSERNCSIFSSFPFHTKVLFNKYVGFIEICKWSKELLSPICTFLFSKELLFLRSGCKCVVDTEMLQAQPLFEKRHPHGSCMFLDILFCRSSQILYQDAPKLQLAIKPHSSFQTIHFPKEKNSSNQWHLWNTDEKKISKWPLFLCFRSVNDEYFVLEMGDSDSWYWHFLGAMVS